MASPREEEEADAMATANWPERQPRPEARTLTDEEKKKLLAGMTKEIASSPVLTGLGLTGPVATGPVLPGATARRGGLCRGRGVGPDHAAGRLGRPAAGAGTPQGKLVRDRQGIGQETHQDHRRRHQGDVPRARCAGQGVAKAGKGLERLPVKREGKTKFVYVGTGEECSVQEALFHHFGLPLHVLVEPSEWYSYHRKPTIVEASKDRSPGAGAVRGESSSGESFGGTCLYACRDGRWGAYRIRPSESRDIASAEAWLVKRKWRQWGS